MGRGVRTPLVFAAALAANALLSAPALAQAPAAPGAQAGPEEARACPGLVASRAPRAIPAALRLAALGADQVRIT